jgi:hypothetical protein
VIYPTDHRQKSGDELNVEITFDHKNLKNFGAAVSSHMESIMIFQTNGLQKIFIKELLYINFAPNLVLLSH